MFSISNSDKEACLWNYRPKRGEKEALDAFMERVALELDSFGPAGIMLLQGKIYQIRRLLPTAFPRTLHSDMDLFHNLTKLKEELDQCKKIILLLENEDEEVPLVVKPSKEVLSNRWRIMAGATPKA